MKEETIEVKDTDIYGPSSITIEGKTFKIARPVGHWVKFREEIDGHLQPEHMKCSICGQYWAISEHADVFKFCFNCGARMKQ